MSLVRHKSLASFIAALFMLAGTTSAMAEPVAQVIRLSGDAEVQRGTSKGPLLLGAALEPGDIISTSARGRLRLQLIDGSTINLGAQSVLTVAVLTSGGPGTDRQIELELGQGAIRTLAAPATPRSRFEIRTPLAVTAVRGTEWGILSGAERSDIIILSGRVGIRRNVISGESAISLTRNLGTTVTAEGLGPIGRWSPDQMSAFEAATAVPGIDVPFSPATAPALRLEPIPSTPGGPGKDQSGSKRPCIDPENINCHSNRGSSREHDASNQGGHKDNSHEHESSGGSGSSF